MALIVCPECGKEISDAAFSCPHCGYPLREKRQQEEYGSEEKQHNDEGKNEKQTISPFVVIAMIMGILSLLSLWWGGGLPIGLASLVMTIVATCTAKRNYGIIAVAFVLSLLPLIAIVLPTIISFF